MVLLGGASVVVGWGLAHAVPAIVGTAPADLDARSISFPSNSESVVHGWLCPVVNSHGAVLLLPGVRANRLSMVDRARFLRRAGFTTLLIDLQATGESPGDHITFGWEERHDVLAAVQFLRSTTPETKIGIIGSSLGGAATLLAAPPLQVDAVVLEAVYPTIERATRHRLRKYAGPLHAILTPMLLWQLSPRLGVSASDLRPLEHVRALRCPLFVISGSADQNTTAEDARELFAAAAEPKQLWIVEGAGHVDLHRFARAEYEERVHSFFANAFR